MLRSPRLVSLDVFRGLTIASMILVNHLGSHERAHAPLLHAKWHGWTFTDTIFPSFLWIVGVAMTLSFARRKAEGADRGRLMLHVLRRSALIFGLGVLMYLYPRFDFETARILGVLQRIAICYFAASAIFLSTGVRGQVAWLLGLLGSYWALMTWVPVPGHGAGVLEPGQSFSNYVDQIVLGAHNYAGTRTWDPEGIVSTLPAIATTLFGILAGHILRMKATVAERSSWLFCMGSLLLIAGSMLDYAMPINKQLWTVSFAVFMAGLSTVGFALCYWLVDVNGWKSWSTPFAIYGMNALAVYFLSGVGEQTLRLIRWSTGGNEGQTITLRHWLYEHTWVPLISPENASMLWGLTNVAFYFLVAWVMYRRKWFVRF